MYFGRYYPNWMTFAFIANQVLVTNESAKASKYSNVDTLLTREQQHFFHRLRPLLADDVEKYTGDEFNQFFHVPVGLDIQNIRLLHKEFLSYSNESRKYKINQQATLFDLVWKMLRDGSSLQAEIHEEREKSPKSTYLEKIKAEMVVGSLLEIGGCIFSSDIANQEKEKTVFAVLQDTEEVNLCLHKTSSVISENMYLSTLSINMLQHFIEDVSTDYKVLFGNILLQDFLSLSTSLLPHEFEVLLARLFSLSKQTFIPNVQIRGHSKYFRASKMWSSPGELFMKACQIAGLNCSIQMLLGFNSWKNTVALYKVTVNKGIHPIHPKYCKLFGGHSQCFATFATNKSSLTIWFEHGRSYISPIETNDVPLQIFLKTDLIKQSKEKIFVKLLHVPYKNLKECEILLSGSDIRTIQLVENISEQAKLITKSRINTSIQKEKDLMPESRTLEESSNVDHLRNWETSHDQTIKFSKLWNREIPSNITTTSLVSNAEHYLRRDQADTETDTNYKSNDETNATEEENQIHKGLDYLHKSDIKTHNTFNLRNLFKKAHMLTTSFVKSKQSKDTPIKYPTIYNWKAQHINKTLLNKNKNNVSTEEAGNEKQMRININKRLKIPLDTKTSLFNNVEKNVQSSTPFKYEGKYHGSSANQNMILKAVLKRNQLKTHGEKFKAQEEKHRSFNKRNILEASQREDEIQKRMKQFMRSYSKQKLGDRQFSSISSVNDIQKGLPQPKPVLKEEVLFDSIWKKMKHFIAHTVDDNNPFSVFVYGQGHQCLLGRKVALLYPHSSVVTIIPEDLHYLLRYHRNFVNLNTNDNNMLLNSDLTVNLVHDMYRMPELFKFQILGFDVFRPILELGKAFMYYFGEILSLGQTTFLEIPSFDQLVFVQQLLNFNSTNANMLKNVADQTEGLIAMALKLVGAEMETPEIVYHESGHSIMKIKMKALQRKVQIGCGPNTYKGYLNLLPDGVAAVIMKNSVIKDRSRIMKGIGLELLLKIGLPAEERMHLFQKYMELEIHQDMCPSYIVWIQQRLQFLPVGIFFNGSNKFMERTKEKLLNQFETQMGDTNFSFMEYNSKESIGLQLAPKFQNSSFIALSEDANRGKEMYNTALKKNLSNFLACILKIDPEFTTKLLKSPDILRYQFVGYEEFLRLLKEFQKEDFGFHIGQILSTGVSTFIQVPNSKIVSLASSTFYPTTVFSRPLNVEVYNADSHPLPIFVEAERRILYESAKADVEIEIRQDVLPEEFLEEGVQVPWKLVRCDIKRLKTLVDHHFDFELDGHERKYFQYVNSENKTHYEVHLIRETDGFKIPYGQISAVSLIALLRMGLLPEIKERFYGEFLNLPLYEDMAPWNIVFRGGRLEYIDYDTKDVTFNKIAPAAYQIMAMLMNYKRTVSDFGHCKFDARNQYGIQYISDCVGSNFKGPCPDSRYPVPCADYSCKATYIDCLKALELLEQQFSRFHQVQPVVKEKPPALREWAFNDNGLLKINS